MIPSGIRLVRAANPARVIQPSNTEPSMPSDRSVGVAQDRHEVVVGEQAGEAERLDPLAGGHQVRPGDGLAPDLEADPDRCIRAGRGPSNPPRRRATRPATHRSHRTGHALAAAGSAGHPVPAPEPAASLSRSEPMPNTASVTTRMTVARALTSGVTPNLIWV